MSAQNVALDNSIWCDRAKYDDAERQYMEQNAQVSLAPLAAEVAKARQRINEMKQNMSNGNVNERVGGEGVVQNVNAVMNTGGMDDVIKVINDRLQGFQVAIESLRGEITRLNTQMAKIQVGDKTESQKPILNKGSDKKDDEDVDLFGSESEDDEAAEKIKEERLAAYNAKKSKKPALIAKSSIILDVKPWDDTTDMKALEKEVRKVTCDGLLWGASKLVPLAYGIHKLQINCVIEDEKVSVDWLQEQIEENEDFVQSVDIAAFNKI